MDELVVDSSVFIAAFKVGDPFHGQAHAVIEQIGTKYRAFVSCLALVEVVGAMGRVVGPKYAKRIRKRFTSWAKGGFITIEELDKKRADEAQLIAIKYGLRGADAVIVQLASEKKCMLASFDEEILQKFEKVLQPSISYRNRPVKLRGDLSHSRMRPARHQSFKNL
ncbi:MAG: PIN domain-containing protein [Candidatus Hodarchaeaceae archaeon]|nr:PIN domain-containing protein [Candidatus Hodarchaeaceae archaeon]